MNLAPVAVMALYLKYCFIYRLHLGGHWWEVALTFVSEMFCAFMFDIWFGGSSVAISWVSDKNRAIENLFVLLIFMLVICCSQFGY
jgi:hypothetical protein